MAKITYYNAVASAPHLDIAGVAGEALEGREQGTPIGYDANDEFVPADAAEGVPMMGVQFPELVRDMDALPAREDYPGLHHEVKDEAQAGDRVVAWHYGLIVNNMDEDWGFSLGDPVYLAEGGGFTQTPPSTAGSIVQCVGVCVDRDDVATGNAVKVDVDFDYETVA